MVQENSLKPKLIIIAGPTAIGKSETAVRIASLFNGEVIGADSMQIYKGMDIGTGKITREEMQGIPHHLIDVTEPDKSFSVSDYVNLAKNTINDILSAGKTPIITGGTGLYINALLNGYNFAETKGSDAVRNELLELCRTKGSDYLHSELAKVDPESAAKISVNDEKRIIRALEIYRITGEPKSKQINKLKEPDYDYKMLVLDNDRSDLYERINKRVDKMFDSGLIDEVRKLYCFKDCQSMQGIGYKEVIPFIDGKKEATEVKDEIKQNSRRYAKRQMTYFRWVDLNKHYIHYDNYKKIEEKVAEFL